MDVKTLEYMEERAGKARKIVDRIDALLKSVDEVKRSRGFIKLSTPNIGIYIELTRSGKEPAENDYETEITASIYNAFIDVTLAEIRHLEKQLAEL